jgi:hypothetical protein
LRSPNFAKTGDFSISILIVMNLTFRFNGALWGFLLLAGFTTAWAQSSWTVKNPYPQSKNLTAATWAGNQWVVVGDSGTVLTSTNAQNWVVRNVGAPNNLKSVAWTGTGLIAVGEKGKIWTSPDGATWTDRSPGTVQSYITLNQVIWAGVQAVVVGDNATLLTSPDGTTWTVHPTPTPTGVPFQAVAFSGNSLRVVGSLKTSLHGRLNVILDSPDGVNWTYQATDGSGDLNSGVVWTGSVFHVSPSKYIRDGSRLLNIYLGTDVLSYKVLVDGSTLRHEGQYGTGSPHWIRAMAKDTGTTFLAVGDSGAILISRDAMKWATSLTLPATFLSITPVGSDILVLGKESSLFRSTDQGATWKVLLSLLTIDSSPIYGRVGSDLRDVLWTGNEYLVLGRASNTTYFYTSPDGASWNEESLPISENLKALAIGNGVLVAAAQKMLSKPPGGSWTARTPLIFMNDVVWTGSRFVAVGDSGTFATSTDGVNWTLGKTSTKSQLNAVVWTGSQLAAVGQNGAVQLSQNGLDWTGFPSGTTGNLASVTWSGTGFTAVGAKGRILFSPNGVVWTSKTSGTTDDLVSVARTGSHLTALSLKGAILTSPIDSPLSIPDVPSLVAPPVSSSGVSQTPDLSWSLSAGAASYRLQLSGSPAFDTLLLDTSTLSNSRTIGPLRPNFPYFWRVRAIGTDGNSSYWSSTGSFITGGGFLGGAPLLSRPFRDTLGMPLTVMLGWRSVANATGYHVQVAVNPAFSPALLLNDSSLSDTTRTLGGLSAARTYYWRVRGKNAQGPGPWSLTWRFSTGSPSIPEAPNLISPAQNAFVDTIRPLLTWSLVGGAAYYRVQASMDSTFAVTAADDSVATTSLRIGPLSENVPYYWRVYAQGDVAGNFSPRGTFTVAPPPTLPLFLQQPMSRTVIVGGQAGFRASASATGGASYRWRKGSVYLANDGRVSGAFTDTLTLANVSLADTGLYNVVAVGMDTTATAISENATLSVNTPPVFMAHPANQSPAVGDSASFNAATAPGPGSMAGTLSYRWRKNGLPLSNSPARIVGAEDFNLVLYGIVASDTGAYDVVATRTLNGTVASTTSLPATLTLTPTSLRPGPLVFRVTNNGRYSFQLPAQAAGAKLLTVRISDVRGRSLWVRSFTPSKEGVNAVSWNGRTSTGQLVPQGVYIVRATATDASGAGESVLQSITLLR